MKKTFKVCGRTFGLDTHTICNDQKKLKAAWGCWLWNGYFWEVVIPDVAQPDDIEGLMRSLSYKYAEGGVE